MTAEVPFQLGAWLRGDGSEADIAVCTRMRLARNLEGHRFSTVMSSREAEDLTAFVNDRIGEAGVDDSLRILDLNDLGDLEREVLVERHLISRDHAHNERRRSVAVDEPESLSIMINEEDHVRSQVFQAGFEPDAVFRRAQAIDERLQSLLPVAFSEEFGYLTACPTNTGTGMRVSVMLHLPGLVWADEIDKATNTAQKIHLAVRGMYGEGSRALGDFYQVSNQVTLGRSEAQILADVSKAVSRLIVWERDVREALLKGVSKVRTLDRIHRSLGVLEHARILTSEEALNCLSSVRLGVRQGLLDGPPTTDLNKALLIAQPAHLQRVHGAPLGPAERDTRRAALIRGLLQG